MADTDARPVDQKALMADIDRTRAELARTIDAISDRVSPKKNVSRAMEQVRQRANEVGQRVNHEVNEVGQRVNREVGQRASQVDPLVIGAAAAAVLVGVTVLFLVRRRRR
jgi:tetrahydromethanopterin S-methyltransferase subunit G